MENDPKPYKFMKESIKKQPPDWKKIVLLIAGWLVLAALGGLVAAAVFAVTEPKIAGAIQKRSRRPKWIFRATRIRTADRRWMRR